MRLCAAARHCGPCSGWLIVCMAAVCWRRTRAQGQPMMEGQAPPGLRAWLGKDMCGAPMWAEFHAGLAEAVGQYNGHSFAMALSSLVKSLAPIVSNAFVAFDCGTAVASGLLLAAQCCDQMNLPVLAARFRQESALFSSFDYQMKGEEYIDQSQWPIRWMESMDGILRSMTFLKQHERTAEPWFNLPLRSALSEKFSSEQRAAIPRQRIAIVSVCDYDPAATPLARLSQINKERYAQMFGYDVVIHEKSPTYEDPLSSLLSEPIAHRPPAWSKVDAILRLLAAGDHDWVYWMDCDSFFMEGETRLEEVTALAESESFGQCSGEGNRLSALVDQWRSGPPADVKRDAGDLLSWYDRLLEQTYVEEEANGCSASGASQAATVSENKTLGWDGWLLHEKRKHLIASEDGLMLNTGNVLVRASSWSWRFFQKVRWLTFGHSPVMQHPWWEQTAMVYLLQLPFSLAQGMTPADSSLPGYAPAMLLVSQKHINSYPPLVASSLRTHISFEVGDFIVSFSGCKVYSSQEVCNQLFLSHFAHAHGLQEIENDAALRPWL